MLQNKIYFAAAIVVFTAAFLILFSGGAKTMKKSSNSPVAVTAILARKLTFPLAPENISTIPLYHVHRNLWDTVVSEHGEPALARLIETADNGRTYRFEIGPDSRFSNGRKVTSADILFSLKRLMGKQPGGHFTLKSMIDRFEVTTDSRFDIRLKEPISSFLYALSTPELGIVPKEACDDEGNLRDLRVTSGPYSVSEEPQADKIVLAKNRFFTRHDPHSPDQVTILLRTSTEDMITAAEQSHFDFLEGYNSTGTDAVQKLKGTPGIAKKITKPSYSAFLVLNSDRLSRAERLSLTRLIDEKFTDFYPLDLELEQRSFELLPPGTFGSLNSVSHGEVSGPYALPKKLKFLTDNPKMTIAKSVIALLESAGIAVEVKPWAGDNTTNEYGDSKGPEYDVRLCGQGMNADYPEIEFHLNMVSQYAWIKAKDEEKHLILTALHSNDRKLRHDIAQKIGAAVLADARIIPLVVRSYVHLYREDRVSIDHITNYDGDIPFWKMKVE